MKQMEMEVLKQCRLTLTQAEAKLIRKRSLLVQLKQQHEKEAQQGA